MLSVLGVGMRLLVLGAQALTTGLVSVSLYRMAYSW